MPLYECDLCKFSTPLKSNYSNHLSSKKHILISQLKPNIKQPNDNKKQPMDNEKTTKVAEVATKVAEVATKVATEFTCRYCDKRFAFRQSMNRHIKYSCNKNKDKEEMKEVIRLLNQRLDQQMEQQSQLLENQRQEFTKILDAQSEQIEKLEHFICNVEIHDSFNTVNHIQHIHLKVLHENEESLFTDCELKNLFVKYSE
jgi:hypothetical protein